MKRQYMGCAGGVANGISTVHLAYVRERTGHALAGARQWIPREHIEDPVRSLVMGLPLDLEFRTRGQLAIDICADAYADGLRGFDFICGDEVYGGCTDDLRRLRRPGPRPDRYPGAATRQARPATPRRTRDDPADHPGDQAPARRRPAPCPPGPLTLVPSAYPASQRRRDYPGQLADGSDGKLSRSVSAGARDFTPGHPAR